MTFLNETVFLGTHNRVHENGFQSFLKITKFPRPTAVSIIRSVHKVFVEKSLLFKGR